MRTIYTMDTIIKADTSLCITRVNCIHSCPGGLFTELAEKTTQGCAT